MDRGPQFDSIDDMFPNGRDDALTPWPTAVGSKTTGKLGYSAAAVNMDTVRDAPLEDVDVSGGNVRATQSRILRQHVAYYGGPQYQETGETSADQGKEGNRFPVIYRKKSGEDIIVSGHHRSAAALLAKKPVKAKVIREI